MLRMEMLDRTLPKSRNSYIIQNPSIINSSFLIFLGKKMRFTIATFNLRNLAKPEVPIYADLMYNNDEYEEKINWTAQQLQNEC